MVAFVPMGDGDRFVRTCIGAESNVLMALAALDYRVRWISRVGDDHLGRYLEGAISSTGVHPVVEFDSRRGTGVAVKEVRESGTTVLYYRTNSAASALSIDDVPPLRDTKWVHMTGVTPALSKSCADLTMAVADRAANEGALFSFDVNLRPVLWSDPCESRRVLVEICRKADLVFIGEDEAEFLTGEVSGRRVAAGLGLRTSQELVLKLGERGALQVSADNEAFEPALDVPVVDVVGAGDAFAAGYLAGYLRGCSASARLRLGNLLAAQVIQTREDVGRIPTRVEIDRVLCESSNTKIDRRPT